MSDPLPAVERTIGNERRIRHTNTAMLVMIAATCLVIAIGALVLFVKVDAKVSHIESTGNAVRSTQIANTHQSNVRSNCQDGAFNDVIHDLLLFSQGDTNYVVPVKC